LKQVNQLISTTFQCSRVAIASVPGALTYVAHFYVLIELHPALLWVNEKALLEEKMDKNQFVQVKLFSLTLGKQFILSKEWM